MLEDKERLKFEFDFLKGLFYILLAFLGGIMSVLFNKDLSFTKYLLSLIALVGLSFIAFKVYLRVKKIYKG